MKKVKRWLNMMTLGQTGELKKLAVWIFFDSFVASIPVTIMLLAIYCLLIPIAQPGVDLPLTQLWIMCGVLLVQFIAYNFIRQKTYIDFCVGFAGTIKDSRIRMGEHLRRLSMGFYNGRDAGDLSTVLLRDYSEIENLSQQILPQIVTVLIRFALMLVMLTAFDWRMMLSVFIVIPLALPFAFLSYRRMNDAGADFQYSQQETSSRILEYVGGIQTLKAFHMAGKHFEALKYALNPQTRTIRFGYDPGFRFASMRVALLTTFICNSKNPSRIACLIKCINLSEFFSIKEGETKKSPTLPFDFTPP